MREINLLPQKSPEEEVSRRKKKERYIVIFAIGAAFVLVWLVPFLYLQTLKFQERTLDAQVSEWEQRIASLSETETLSKSVFHKAAAALVILQSRKTLLESIQNLEGFLFPGITMNSVALIKDRATMTVNTSDIGSIITFLASLEKKEKTQFLSDLTISSVSVNPATGYEVAIEGTIIHAQ